MVLPEGRSYYSALRRAKKSYYPEFRDKIRIIPQGFRFDNIRLDLNMTKNKVPTFAYSGIFYHGIRNPSPFLNYLSTLDKSFKFVVYTRNVEFLEPYRKTLGDKMEVRDYLPREDLLYELSKMDFLINFENNTNLHLPSKLIDYAMVKKPILNIQTGDLPVDAFNEFLQGTTGISISCKILSNTI
jgi:hypothetical protein